jgi:hypothetical protein
MSVPHTDPAAAAPAPDDGFTPTEAEAVIRRAVRIHERTADAVSIEELKQTLASLGVAPEAVERAAAELRAEMQEVSQLRKPSDVMGPLAAMVFFAAPAVTLLLYRDRVGGMQGWMVVAFSLMLAGGTLSTLAGKLFMWYVGRRVRARG